MSAEALILPLTLLSGMQQKNIPFLKDPLDKADGITKLIKKSTKREAEFHRKQAEFLGQMELDFHIHDMNLPTLKILCPIRWTFRAPFLSAILKNRNFDEAMGMGTRQCL